MKPTDSTGLTPHFSHREPVVMPAPSHSESTGITTYDPLFIPPTLSPRRPAETHALGTIPMGGHRHGA